MMTKLNNSRRAGFTLVELMIVVAIIALLASIAIPSALRARKRSQATSTLATIRLIDGAKDQWAIENGKKGGDAVLPADIKPYVKVGSKLEADLTAGAAKDALGNAITIGNIDAKSVLDATSVTEFAGVLGASGSTAWVAFWGGLL